MWAEAAWSCWLPRSALVKMCSTTVHEVIGADNRPKWCMVRGPAASFAASCARLLWVDVSATAVTTDRGTLLDFTRDSPAMIRREVCEAVRRWRWRRIEKRLPALIQGDGGYGLHIQPLFMHVEHFLI